MCVCVCLTGDVRDAAAAALAALCLHCKRDALSAIQTAGLSGNRRDKAIKVASQAVDRFLCAPMARSSSALRVGLALAWAGFFRGGGASAQTVAALLGAVAAAEDAMDSATEATMEMALIIACALYALVGGIIENEGGGAAEAGHSELLQTLTRALSPTASSSRLIIALRACRILVHTLGELSESEQKAIQDATEALMGGRAVRVIHEVGEGRGRKEGRKEGRKRVDSDYEERFWVGLGFVSVGVVVVVINWVCVSVLW